jgi:thiamine-phosphate pyrophosphorylase
MIQNRLPRKGLYAITSGALTSPEKLLEAVEQAIRGGAAVIQYRDKDSPDTFRTEQAMALSRLCQEWKVPFIVNDDPLLARECGADGVHIGQRDGGYASARELLGAKAIIGVSCHDSLDQALAAQAQGADYVALGRFFPSQTKPHAPPARIETLRAARRRLNIPIVAIGGITPENGADLIEAGADFLAVIHGIFGQPHPEAAARAYATLFSSA